jgi:hypothetical protein
MKKIFTATTLPTRYSPDADREGEPGFWVSIDDQSYLPIDNRTHGDITASDYDEVASLFASREGERNGKKTTFHPMTFARRFLFFYDQAPVFHEPIIVEE